MSDLLIGFLSAVLATNTPAALSNLVHQKTGIAVPVANPNDPVEQEYHRIMDQDDAALAEIDAWIKESHASQGSDEVKALDKALLNARIRRRLETVEKAYEDFLSRHPRHTGARMAYASFLNDSQREEAAAAQWEKVREQDPADAAAWNNLANHYGHNGPVEKAFDYYAKAIELNPRESIYYHNYGTTVYLFRRAAMAHFKIDEDAVFAKAVELYRKAVELDPTNFELATDVAQTYYGIKPPKTGNPDVDRQAEQTQADQALAAWQHAYQLARDDIERQGILIHYARININAGRFIQARQHLDAVTLPLLDTTKQTLLKKLDAHEKAK